jgi:hypothetical protein
MINIKANIVLRATSLRIGNVFLVAEYRYPGVVIKNIFTGTAMRTNIA